MSSVNKVILIGRTGQDPAVSNLNNGGKVVNISLATSEKFTDRAGVKQENTEWHNLVVYGKLADIFESYIKKGSQIYVEGTLNTRTWDDQQGQKRYKTEIKVLNMTMLGSKQESNQDYGGYN